jgi:ribosome maturation factor RimP
MINEKDLATLIKKEVAQRDCFLVHFSVDGSQIIKVVIDNLSGIRLEEIAQVSRAIERALNEQKIDFELTVTSPGVGEPLQVAQQFEQNVGRKLKVKTEGGQEFKGRLSAFENDELTLNWKVREPKPVGKGKRTVTKQEIINRNQITQARVQVEFK